MRKTVISRRKALSFVGLAALSFTVPMVLTVCLTPRPRPPRSPPHLLPR